MFASPWKNELEKREKRTIIGLSSGFGKRERIRGTYPTSLYFAEVLPDIPRTWCSVRRLG